MKIEAIEILINFGLTRQEANIYVLLCVEGKLNGYEVSKKTGISRSNTYNALAGLVDKGAAYIIEGNAVQYIPVNVEEFCENKIRFLQKSREELIEKIPKQREESDSYITIKSEKHILDKMKNMLVEVKERVYISMDMQRVEYIIPELEALKDKNIKIVIITNPPFIFEGAKVYHSIKKPDQIRIIIDSTKVLTGDIKDKENSTCLYSTNNNLVEVFKEALSNEIKLIEIEEG